MLFGVKLARERAATLPSPTGSVWLAGVRVAWGCRSRELRQGAVALVLAHIDPAAGVVTPLSRQNVHRTIKVAVGHCR